MSDFNIPYVKATVEEHGVVVSQVRLATELIPANRLVAGLGQVLQAGPQVVGVGNPWIASLRGRMIWCGLLLCTHFAATACQHSFPNIYQAIQDVAIGRGR